MDNLHLHLEFPEFINKEIVESEVDSFEEIGINVDYKVKETEVFASIEWTIPTAIAAYVLKPYFESFLQEAGKTHFEILSSKLKKLTSLGKKMNVKLVAAEQSPEKLNKSYNQSHAISLMIQTNNGKFIKLLFDNDLEKSDWDSAIDQIFDFVIEHYEKNNLSKLSIMTKDLETERGYMIYAKINKESKLLEFYDNTKMFEEIRKNK